MAIQLDPSIVQTRADALAAARRHCFEEAGRQHVAPVRQHPLAVAVVQLMLEDVAAGVAPPLWNHKATPAMARTKIVAAVARETGERMIHLHVVNERVRNVGLVVFGCA